MVKDSLVSWLGSDVASIKGDSPPADGNEPGQHPEDGRLASPVRPDDAGHLTAIQFEVNIPNHLDRTIGHIQILCLK
jgi:hypothetical protein